MADKKEPGPERDLEMEERERARAKKMRRRCISFIRYDTPARIELKDSAQKNKTEEPITATPGDNDAAQKNKTEEQKIEPPDNYTSGPTGLNITYTVKRFAPSKIPVRNWTYKTVPKSVPVRNPMRPVRYKD